MSRRTLTGLAKQLLAGLLERDRLAGRTRKVAAPPTSRVPSGVTIEYTPDIDADADPGEVVWTWVPYEDDPRPGKDRPVVVIGRTGRQLAGVPLTSKHKGRHDDVAVGSGGWDRSGRPSYAKVDRLLTIDPAGVRREGSVLSRDRFDAVVSGVERFHDLARPTEDSLGSSRSPGVSGWRGRRPRRGRTGTQRAPSR